MRKNKGITLIALIIMIVVLLILAGITLGTTNNKKGTIKQTEKIAENAQRESIIEKIEADLYNEKIKTGKQQTKENLKILIQKKGYSRSIGEDEFITKEGNYTIQYNEITGWK